MNIIDNKLTTIYIYIYIPEFNLSKLCNNFLLHISLSNVYIRYNEHFCLQKNAHNCVEFLTFIRKQYDDNSNNEKILNRKLHYKELINLAPYQVKLDLAIKNIEEFILYLDNKKDNLTSVDILLSFSGGKDSTVLLDLVCRTMQSLINNNLLKKRITITPSYAFEITFPETISFIKKHILVYQQNFSFVNDLYLAKPKLPWDVILREKGYPIYSKQQSVLLNRIKNIKSKNGLSRWIFKINTAKLGLTYKRLFLLDDEMKNYLIDETIDLNYFKDIDFKDYKYSEKCCDYIKGGLKHIKKPTFVGTMASESELRKNSWIKNGCNIINTRKELSRPLSTWRSVDVWKYIIKNDLDINKKYGYKKEDYEYKKILHNNKSNLEINEKLNNKLNSTLKYKRLGCISCPYGSHLDIKDSAQNRFEILKDESEELYLAQVIKNGMYKILIDMQVPINNDEKYMKLYRLRQGQIDNWYKDFDNNLASIIVQIENYKNYKKFDLTKKKFMNSSWHYTDEELIKIYRNYSSILEDKEILNKVNKLRFKKIKGVK